MYLSVGLGLAELSLAHAAMINDTAQVQGLVSTMLSVRSLAHTSLLPILL